MVQQKGVPSFQASFYIDRVMISIQMRNGIVWMVAVAALNEFLS
jgi:hypothetical protein